MYLILCVFLLQLLMLLPCTNSVVLIVFIAIIPIVFIPVSIIILIVMHIMLDLVLPSMCTFSTTITALYCIRHQPCLCRHR